MAKKPEINELFANNVRVILGDRTPYWLAKESGISESNISRLLSGKINASLKTLQKIANSLGVRPYELIKDQKFNDEIPADILAMLKGQDEIVLEAIRGVLKPLTKKKN